MKNSNSRDNTYWTGRLKKDGHDNVLEQVKAGEISMYRARQLAGYIKMTPKSSADKLSYHWKRASYDERFKFAVLHNRDLLAVLTDIRAEADKSKDNADEN